MLEPSPTPSLLEWFAPREAALTASRHCERKPMLLFQKFYNNKYILIPNHTSL